MDQPDFLAIGECMIELNERADGGLDRAYGGDTLNACVYLARLAHGSGGGSGIGAGYVTALGDDPYSADMLAGWRAEGIDCGLVARIPGALPGLYAIRTDPAGERSFCYWRSAAAARRMLRALDPEALRAALAAAATVYLSGVSLSILDADDRARLLALLGEARAAGARIAFDPNYRPRGWPDAETARRAIAAVARHVDIALPTFDDEAALFADDSPAATVARWTGWGVGEIAVKDGPRPATLGRDGACRQIPGLAVEKVRDTTAAGDAFNAAYLFSRLCGRPADAAARAGHGLAAQVIRHPGAIMPLPAMPAFADLDAAAPAG